MIISENTCTSYIRRTLAFGYEIGTKKCDLYTSNYDEVHYGAILSDKVHYGAILNVEVHYGAILNVEEHYGAILNVEKHYGASTKC